MRQYAAKKFRIPQQRHFSGGRQRDPFTIQLFPNFFHFFLSV